MICSADRQNWVALELKPGFLLQILCGIILFLSQFNIDIKGYFIANQ